jgi:hypothetical protein
MDAACRRAPRQSADTDTTPATAAAISDQGRVPLAPCPAPQTRCANRSAPGSLCLVDIGQWNSLEVAKLAVAALTPVAVAVIGWIVARSVRRLEDAQWENRKLIELRLALHDQIAGPLNDVMCFFRLRGDYQNLTPPDVIERKRKIDKAFHVNRALMDDEFIVCYRAFINHCFAEFYWEPGRPAALRASVARQRAARRHDWDTEWDEYFVEEDDEVTDPERIESSYNNLMECFSEQIGVRRPQ